MKILKRLRLWLTPDKMCRHCCLWCEYAPRCCEEDTPKKGIRELLWSVKYKLGLAREGVDFITPGMEDEHENGE